MSIKTNRKFYIFMLFIINTIRTFYFFLYSEWGCIPFRCKKFFKLYFLPAIEKLSNKDIDYKEARNFGLFYLIEGLEITNFHIKMNIWREKKALEYEELNEKTIEFLNRKIQNSKYPRLLFLVWALQQPISPYGSWYGKLEEIYLLAQYLFARQNGATKAQAIHWAHKWLYFQPAAFLPPIARFARKSSIGQYWSIFFYSIPRFLEVFLTRPWIIFGTFITLIVFLFLWLTATLELFILKRNKIFS